MTRLFTRLPVHFNTIKIPYQITYQEGDLILTGDGRKIPFKLLRLEIKQCPEEHCEIQNRFTNKFIKLEEVKVLSAKELGQFRMATESTFLGQISFERIFSARANNTYIKLSSTEENELKAIFRSRKSPPLEWDEDLFINVPGSLPHHSIFRTVSSGSDIDEESKNNDNAAACN